MRVFRDVEPHRLPQEHVASVLLHQETILAPKLDVTNQLFRGAEILFDVSGHSVDQCFIDVRSAAMRVDEHEGCQHWHSACHDRDEKVGESLQDDMVRVLAEHPVIGDEDALPVKRRGADEAGKSDARQRETTAGETGAP